MMPSVVVCSARDAPRCSRVEGTRGGAGAELTGAYAPAAASSA